MTLTQRNEEIRSRILKLLYEKEKENLAGWGIDRYAIQEAIDYPEADIDYNMLYLLRNNLVSIKESINVPWHWAKITNFGIDVYENKEHYTEDFPFVLKLKRKKSRPKKSAHN